MFLFDIASNDQTSYPEELPAIFRRYGSDIGIALREGLAGRQSQVYQMLRYSMGWTTIDGASVNVLSGKALRPTLCIFACEATGGDVREALPAAVSLEFIHNFSLIHDDVQDRDETRHHRPTLWKVWGNPKAILAGNILWAIADISLGRLLDKGVGLKKTLRIMQLLNRAHMEMIEGQYLDISFEGRSDVTLPNYMDMISKKTGAFMRSALAVGALIGSGDASIVRAFIECGRSLGLVFQIRDDILGIWGDESITGKPVGSDIRQKKNSLPLLYAMSKTKGADKELMSNVYQNKVLNDDDVASIMDVLAKVNAKEYSERLASKHRLKAIEALSKVKMTTSVIEEMDEVAMFLQLRKH